MKAGPTAQFHSVEGHGHDREPRKQHESGERPPSLESNGRVQHALAAIEHHVTRPGVVAVLGSAEGPLQFHLRERGWRTWGVEPAPRIAATIQEQTPDEVRADAVPDLPESICDLLVARDVFSSSPDPLAFAYAARKALRPGGLLLIELPLASSDDAAVGAVEHVFRWEEHPFVFSRASLMTLLETAGFEIVENHDAWQPGHEIAIARAVDRPVRRLSHLANLRQMFSPEWSHFIDELNAFGAPHGLRQFTNWSKLWEYPWLWHHGLSALDWRGRRVVDLGSEQSPFPWWLATKGARVTLVETRRDWIEQWEAVRTALGGPAIDWQIVDSCHLPFQDGSIDVVTSFSVIEHQDDKPLAFREVARVLKPGGLFAASFDICEPAMGMTFPEWNGRALTMREFESLASSQPGFSLPEDFEWNVEDIPSFLRWHRQTAPHHNYVTGAAVLRKRRPGLLARLLRR